jgi:YbbR domain-containing protein
MRNPALKVLSLFIALLLSYFVNSEENSTVFTFVAPVEVRDLPAGKVLPGNERLQAQVTIRGPSFVLSRIPAAPPVFRVSASDVVEGKVQLRRNELALPPYVDIVSIQPAELKLHLDDLVELKVAVKAPLLGPVATEHRVESVVVDPESVTLRGAKGAIGGISAIQTEPVDVRELKKTVTRGVPLRLPEGILGSSVNEVSVEVRIAPVETRRELERMPVEVRSVGGETYTLEPPVVRVTLRGRREIFEGLKRDHVIPFVRLGKEYRERELVEVGVELPTGITLERVDPPRVEIIRSRRSEKKVK